MLRGHSQHVHSCWASFTLAYQMNHSMLAFFCTLGTRLACSLSWGKWHSVSRRVMRPLQQRQGRQNGTLLTRTIHQGRRWDWMLVAQTPIGHSNVLSLIILHTPVRLPTGLWLMNFSVNVHEPSQKGHELHPKFMTCRSRKLFWTLRFINFGSCGSWPFTAHL